MRDFLRGMLLPAVLPWRAVCLACRGAAAAYGVYYHLVESLGPPWAGLVHSTVFLSLGEGAAWLAFRLF